MGISGISSRAALGGLLLWAPLVWSQRPSDADAAALIDRSRERSLTYTHLLPDFVCTEVIRRFRESKSTDLTSTAGSARTPCKYTVPADKTWNPTDKLTVTLSFIQQGENHKLILLNDKPTDLKYEAMSGATVKGEFGGMLQSIFDPSSHTNFRWRGWKKAGKRRIAVYLYEVSAADSEYLLANGPAGDTHSAIVGFHGELEIESETGDIVHFSHVASQIPKELELESVLSTVDYDYADVGGQAYLLPVRSQTEMRSPQLSVKNETEFRDYHKFDAKSVVDFGLGK
jgi:hypothetical protein